MGQSHPALARSLPESFPSVDIITHPDLARLASVIQQLLGWGSKKLLTTFHTNIWPVIILHELLEDLANNSPESNEVHDCYMSQHTDRHVIQKTLAGISGHNTDVPTDMLEKATLQLLNSEELASGYRIYDSWVKTMFLSSSGDPCMAESTPLSMSYAVHQSPAHIISDSAASTSSTSIIDLTEDEDAGAFAGSVIIDLTVDDDNNNSDLIDLTL
ncbi:hypothetical protein BDR05DRAFT_1004400 [Suillus weaverae]|nr:hypothetical protein BDR05DRAFT_1004400 [Suillus weaverae]